MFRRLEVIYRIIKSDGIIFAIKWLMTILYRRLVPQKQVIWCTDLTRIDTKGFSLPDNVTIERFHSMNQLSDHDLKSLITHKSDLMGSAASILINERFTKGASLWLLKENGLLAGYRWTIANNHVTPTHIPHTETDVHSIGIEIFEDFRGRRLHDIFQTSMFIELKKEGAYRFYAETFLWNKRAIKAMAKYGLRKIGTATMFNVFGKTVVIWHDMSNNITIK